MASSVADDRNAIHADDHGKLRANGRTEPKLNLAMCARDLCFETKRGASG